MKNKAFLEDLDSLPCLDPEHNPPHHICVPAGKTFKHTCSSCGKTVHIRSTLIFG